MESLRLLNFDDLYLLKILLRNPNLTNAAKELHLTQPALSQRVRKIEGIFNLKFFHKQGRNVFLTEEAKAICNKSVAALSIMAHDNIKNEKLELTLGTRPEAGKSWLWPAVIKLRKKYSLCSIHCYFGSGDEIIRGLEIGRLDAILTSAPYLTRGFPALELAKEQYVFVAKKKLAEQIKTISDLQNCTLIEHDRSLPFLRYLDAKARSQMKFKDIWFAGSTVCMADAISEGFGVGIIPEYLAKRSLAKRIIKPINLNVKIGCDYFRLIYTNQRDITEPIKKLAQLLISNGLR